LILLKKSYYCYMGGIKMFISIVMIIIGVVLIISDKPLGKEK